MDSRQPDGLSAVWVLSRARAVLGRWRGHGWLSRDNPIPTIMILGVVLAATSVANPVISTLAKWTNPATVTGAAVSTGTLAAPTSFAVSQSCVADPTPVRRSGAGGFSFTSGTASGTLTIAKPADAQAGDVLVAGIAWFGDHSSYNPAPPTGWTLVVRNGDSTIGHFTYSRVVTASEPSSYSWTGLAEASAGGIAAYSGVDTVTPFNATGGQVDTVSGQITAPSITTSRANAVLVGLFAIAGDNPITPPASMTGIWGGTSASGDLATKQVTVSVAQQGWPTAGATGTRTATAAGGSPSVGQLVALQPPAKPYATSTWTPSTSSYATGQTFQLRIGSTKIRQVSLSKTATTETDGPLTTGTGYNTRVFATFNNWESSATTVSFTARSC